LSGEKTLLTMDVGQRELSKNTKKKKIHDYKNLVSYPPLGGPGPLFAQT
jgi:hypothetical protein